MNGPAATQHVLGLSELDRDGEKSSAGGTVERKRGTNAAMPLEA